MAYIRKHRDKWQSIIRVQGHPHLAKSFTSRTDAKRWALETELKIRREDAGVAKIHFPKFEDVAKRATVWVIEINLNGLRRCLTALVVLGGSLKTLEESMFHFTATAEQIKKEEKNNEK